MKNSKKNKEKWLEKVKCTLELGGRSSKTFLNYKSHIIRFLNNFADDIEIIFFCFFLSFLLIETISSVIIYFRYEGRL